MSEETANEKPLSSEPKKRGPKPKNGLENKIAELEDRIDRLVETVVEMAHYSGSPKIPVKNGFHRHNPELKSKHHG